MRHLRSKHHIPTVGPEGLSDVVGRVVGGQEDDRRRDLVHLAEAPDRERGLACLLQLLALCGHDPGRYRAGGYGVDQDAPRGDLARERFGEGYDASLARAVVGEQRSTGLTDLGCDVDDPTSTPLEHVRQDETTAQKRAAQVHTEHPVPLLDRHLLERSLTEDARVVDQNVDPPESLLNRIDHAPYLVFPCDVRAYEDPTPTLALHLSQYGRGLLFGEQVGHGHIRALSGERLHDGASYAARPTGDDGPLVIEPAYLALQVRSSPLGHPAGGRRSYRSLELGPTGGSYARLGRRVKGEGGDERQGLRPGDSTHRFACRQEPRVVERYSRGAWRALESHEQHERR